jgi:thioredoxin reductase (NADPH)
MKKNESGKYDVIIIGGGAAGMSAALWCDELQLNALLLESKKELGGQLHSVYNPIENHLGVTAKNGNDLNRIFLKQIEKRKFEIRLNSKVKDVNFKTKSVQLTDGSEFSARAIVIATGTKRRKLGVEGEDHFQGKGILESGKREAEKVKGKTVAIIGGGDAALENALILAENAAKVYLIHRRKELRGRNEFVSKIVENKKIKLLTETKILEICGDQKLKSIKIEDISTNKILTLPIDALLLRIGVEPNTEIFRAKLEVDKGGYIKSDSDCETSVKNIFAIGDVANPISLTVSTAVGTGATVGKILFDKLTNIQ